MSRDAPRGRSSNSPFGSNTNVPSGSTVNVPPPEPATGPASGPPLTPTTPIGSASGEPSRSGPPPLSANSDPATVRLSVVANASSSATGGTLATVSTTVVVAVSPNGVLASTRTAYVPFPFGPPTLASAGGVPASKPVSGSMLTQSGPSATVIVIGSLSASPKKGVRSIGCIGVLSIRLSTGGTTASGSAGVAGSLGW